MYKKMCIHCSSYGTGCRFSIIVLVSSSNGKRNGVYKMCIHRSSNCGGCKFSTAVGVGYSSD